MSKFSERGSKILTGEEFFPRIPLPPVEWIESRKLIAYPQALEFMEKQAAAIARGEAGERIWLLEHPPLFTLGTSAKPTDVLTQAFPVYEAGRGGQVTYHGPGQKIIYVMLNLTHRRKDVRSFVIALEQWIISSLAEFGIIGKRVPSRVGVWVPRPDKPNGSGGQPAEDKIAAIGIRIRHWVSFHGISLNINPNLKHFENIVACGISEPHLGITSLYDLKKPFSEDEISKILLKNFQAIFGPAQPIDKAQPIDTKDE